MRQLCPTLTALCCLFAALSPAAADSPVTSTPFAKAYLDHSIVRVAAASSYIDEPVLACLADGNQPLDVKAAVINALGWDADGKTCAPDYWSLRRPGSEGLPAPDDLGGHDAFVIGYLQLMDDYFHADKALPYLARARKLLPESTTVAVIQALAEAQQAMDDQANWPKLYGMVQSVVDDTSLNGDLRLGAVRVIMDYMALYQAEA
jgi:hypothetical protein